MGKKVDLLSLKSNNEEVCFMMLYIFVFLFRVSFKRESE